MQRQIHLITLLAVCIVADVLILTMVSRIDTLRESAEYIDPGVVVVGISTVPLGIVIGVGVLIEGVIKKRITRFQLIALSTTLMIATLLLRANFSAERFEYDWGTYKSYGWPLKMVTAFKRSPLNNDVLPRNAWFHWSGILINTLVALVCTSVPAVILRFRLASALDRSEK